MDAVAAAEAAAAAAAAAALAFFERRVGEVAPEEDLAIALVMEEGGTPDCELEGG